MDLWEKRRVHDPASCIFDVFDRLVKPSGCGITMKKGVSLEQAEVEGLDFDDDNQVILNIHHIQHVVNEKRIILGLVKRSLKLYPYITGGRLRIFGEIQWLNDARRLSERVARANSVHT